MDEPIAIPLPLPRDYGKATKPMAWSEADCLLTESRVYRIATTRPDGRPHVGDGLSAAVIAEGPVAKEKPERDIAQRLADPNNTKYADYGYRMTAESYTKSGLTALRARHVLAWTKFPENATRFVFGSNDA